jgi:putative addiction module component (TIGR02574 family)
MVLCAPGAESGGADFDSVPYRNVPVWTSFHVIENCGVTLILIGMTDELKSLLQRALRLPPEARAALAGSLLDSLDQEVDDDAEAAWSSEIARRVSELDSGKVQTIPWSEVRRGLLGA